MYRQRCLLIALIAHLASLLLVYWYLSTQAVSNLKPGKMVVSVKRKLEEFASFDDYCDMHGEWETLGEDVFIKRSGGFYFHDASLLHLHLIQKSDKNYSFQAEISLIDRGDNKIMARFNTSWNSTKMRMQWQIGEYNSSVITSRVIVPVEIKSWRNVAMSVRVYDLVSGHKTKSDLNVGLKRLNGDYKLKKGNILCTKSFHLKKNDYLTLRWWIELNKQIGYDKIYMWNHDIEKDPTYSRLFQAYSDFVTLDRLECLPNLQQRLPRFQNQTYLKHHTDLVYNVEDYAILKYELINQLLLNECYLNHIDQFRYVTICDIDETVIPKKTQFLSQLQVLDFIRSGAKVDDVKCDRYESTNQVENKKTLESYLNELAFVEKIGKPVSYYVKHGFYLYNSTVKKVIDSIGEILNTPKDLNQTEQNSTNTSYNHIIQVFDFVDDAAKRINFSFTIKTEPELEYATRVYKMYKTVIEPYLNNNIDLIQSNTRDYDRFFFVGDRVNYFANGKTIHDTRSTFDLSIHYAEHRILNQSDVDYNNKNYWEMYKWINYDYAHLSHFRREIGYLSSRYQSLSIESFKLDINYFVCYFKPILSKFSTIKI